MHEVEGQTQDNTKCIRVNIFIRNSCDGSKARAREKSQEEQQITPDIFQNISPSIVSFFED